MRVFNTFRKIQAAISICLPYTYVTIRIKVDSFRIKTKYYITD